MVKSNRQRKEKEDDARPMLHALANSPSPFVLINLQKLSMNAFASAPKQPSLQTTNNTQYNELPQAGKLTIKKIY